MAAKKKTVKDLNVDVSNLALKMKQFEEVIKGVSSLNEVNDLDKKLAALDKNEENELRIKNLEMEVTRLNSVVDDLRNTNKEEISNPPKDCKVCNQKFNSRKELNLHRKSEHPKQIKCKFCEETFDETYKLEQHLKKHESKGFKCEHCEKMFHLEWRFNKHLISHSVKTTRKCHYFNNDKICPYEEIGGMFLHEATTTFHFYSKPLI